MLLRQSWRNSINRFAEAMTLFAVACAGMFPLLHMGRPWLGVLAVSLSQFDGGVAAVPQSAGVGRVCGFYIRDDFIAVLVRRVDPRFGDVARSARTTNLSASFSERWRWDGAARPGIGRGMKRRTCCSLDWPLPWCSRFTPW